MLSLSAFCDDDGSGGDVSDRLKGTGEATASHSVVRADATATAEWQQYYSDSEQYERTDVFNEEVVSLIEQTLHTRSWTKRIQFSITVASIVAFLVSGLLLLSGSPAPVYDGSTESIVGIIQYALDSWFGWSAYLTGNSYTISAAISLVVGLLSQTQLSAELLAEADEYKKVIEEVRRETKGAKQIYPGSGRLKFAFGQPGFIVTGGNVELRIKWDAIWMLMLFTKEETKHKGKTTVSYKKTFHDFTFVEDEIGLDAAAVERTTHLLIFLEPTSIGEPSGSDKRDSTLDAAEYLVVPQRFFQNRRDASRWSDFVNQLIPYKRRHMKVQRSAVLADGQAK